MMVYAGNRARTAIAAIDIVVTVDCLERAFAKRTGRTGRPAFLKR